jgi:hypothetical protein
MRRVPTILCAIAFLTALGASLYFAFAPVYRSEGTAFDSDGRAYRTSTPAESLLDVNGARALPALLIPAVVALIPLVARRRGAGARPRVALACGLVLLLFAFVASWSIGTLYVPSAVLLLAAAIPSARADA